MDSPRSAHVWQERPISLGVNEIGKAGGVAVHVAFISIPSVACRMGEYLRSRIAASEASSSHMFRLLPP